jgi:hypothetical protein
MRKIAATKGLAAFLAIWGVSGAAPALAGALPLCRDALLNVPAGKFEVAVFHRGTLNETEERLVNVLRDAPKVTGANIEVYSVDLVGNVEERLQLLWDSQTNAALPWIAVRPPGARGESPSIWSGQLKAEIVTALLDSPARRKIAEGLRRGDAAVWILLESGDVMRDEAAVDRLASELKAMETKLKPNLDSAAAPISFSLVRLTPNDEAEELLTSILVRGDRALRTKPTAYPVFGRGRILQALAGRHLNDENIRKSCVLLTSGLTNAGGNFFVPGRELLLNANWDTPALTQAPAGAKTDTMESPTSSGNLPSVASNSPLIPRTSVVVDPTSGRKTWIGHALFWGVLAATAAGYLLRSRSRR